jgi:hypothetical protein
MRCPTKFQSSRSVSTIFVCHTESTADMFVVVCALASLRMEEGRFQRWAFSQMGVFMGGFKLRYATKHVGFPKVTIAILRSQLQK